ncbi:hypothetical protein BBJ28_00023290 [Nothophytophthora sp. Chile5]|nr:hypothetical protein BBJ28_00023290 [Nothophytophthora sp. Chile5]
MGRKRKRSAAAAARVDASDAPSSLTQELYQLVVSALVTLELPTTVSLHNDKTQSDAAASVSDLTTRLGLANLKREPKLLPLGGVHSSDMAVRLFYACRKASTAEDRSFQTRFRSPEVLAAACVAALCSELSARPYRHVLRVWLPDAVAIGQGLHPDRILVHTREFAQRRASYLADEAVEASDLPLTFLFRDEAIVVVDKPANVLSVDGTDPSAPPSVHRCIAKEYPEARMVHRLDQETSGLLVVALTKSAAQSLNAQFRDRSVHKTYIARVFGCRHPTLPLVQQVVSDRQVDAANSL